MSSLAPIKWHVDKKAFLWALFFVQVCLIAGVLLFSARPSPPQQQLLQQQQSVQTQTHPIAADERRPAAASGIVEFLHRNDSKTQSQQEISVQIVTSGRYEHEFVGPLHCFRDGLARRPPLQHHNETAGPAPRSRNRVCVCKPDYHGTDCGQPEVIWRAFMTAKMPLKLAAIPRRQPHSVFYLIHAAAAIAVAQLETLEVQIMELAHVVDMFVLCGARSELRTAIRGGPLNVWAHKILLLSAKTEKARKSTGHSSSSNGCSLRSMYAQFRKHFTANATSSSSSSSSSTPAATVRTDDVLLVSGADEILNWRAVKYFKWYDGWPQPVQFRLKYLVYGYYWQHPQSTWLAGGASQVSVLEEVHRGDPRRLAAASKPGMIVGDLNHVGGWYCQYCYHPLNVVRRVRADREAANEVGEARLEGGQVEKWIANGLFVDGKLGLTRLHRFADKYYAPECVRNASWRYEGVLSNVYATYDDDYAK